MLFAVLLRRHLLASAIVVAAMATAGVVVANARHVDGPRVIPPPPDHGLPYEVVSFSVDDARRAFAVEGVRLRPRSSAPTVTTLGNRGDVLEVGVFGARDRVERSGFYDYTAVNGRYVHFARTCGHGATAAERWRGNVRVMVSCTAADGRADAWLARVDRALVRLASD